MFRIAICEDEKAQREYLSKLLDLWQERSGRKAVVSLFTSAEQFMFETEGKYPYDLFLLDIQMGQMNGVELARKIREKDTEVVIIFLTGIKDYAIEGYEVGAVRYLLKPVKETEFFAIFSKFFLKRRKIRSEAERNRVVRLTASARAVKIGGNAEDRATKKR